MKHIRQAHHERAGFQPFEVELLPPRVHDSFLEPGFHYKHIPIARDASEWLATMSISGMRSIALLSLDPQLLLGQGNSSTPIDLLDELVSSDALFNEDMLTHWLATSCSCDSIIIDASDELLQAAWFGPFETALVDSRCHKQMPIVFLFR